MCIYNRSGRRARRVCVVCVCVCVCVCVYVYVCARSLRAAVVRDLCPFGGRKCACGGVGGVARVGEMSMGKGVVGRSGGENKSERKNKVRNDGYTANGLKTYLIIMLWGHFLDLLSNCPAVPVRPRQPAKFTLCIPTGSTTLATTPAEGKAKRGKRIK